MTHAVDVRRRERSAVRQPPEDPALLHAVDRLRAELEPFAHKKTGSIRIDMDDVRIILAALNAYREGKR